MISTSFDMERPSSERMKAALDRNRQACMRSLYRIKEGIDLLATDDDAYAAFCLMNRAIWLQFINKKKAKDAKGPYVVDHSDHSGTWRAFQLGFILQILPSIVDHRHVDRDIVDLLWVSTGAGKTEAYLGLVAFQLFHNRISKRTSDRDGVEVIMRYTLRLLTLQQFQRAARLILACEYIRLNDDYEVISGCKPFSLGLYVGQSMTPNSVRTGKNVDGFDNDYDLYEKLYKSGKKEYGNPELCGKTAEYAIYPGRTRNTSQRHRTLFSFPARGVALKWGQTISSQSRKIGLKHGARILDVCSTEARCPYKPLMIVFTMIPHHC